MMMMIMIITDMLTVKMMMMIMIMTDMLTVRRPPC